MQKILFLGTPRFAVPILEELHKNFKIIGVVTQPDRPVGRKLVITPPPVKTKADELGLQIYQPEKASEILDLVESEVDFIITAAYGEYLPEQVLKMPKKDALNVHPSLLPKYRGATPMQSALLNGDMKTGVSIIRMVKEMDAGEIFAQSELEIDPEIKYPELEEECSRIGALLITEVLQRYESITPVEQEASLATHCKKIERGDGKIDWKKETAQQIFNKLRAFTPWPGIFTEFKQMKLNILDAVAHPTKNSSLQPGHAFQEDNQVFVQSSKGSLELKTLQLPGKTPTDIKSFLNGHPYLLSATLK